MPEKVTVEYMGNTPDLTLSLPYLSQKVKFADGKNRTAQMLRHEAEQLVAENPMGFRVVEAAQQAFTPVLDDGIEGSGPEGEGGQEQASHDEALEAVESYLKTLPDNQAIIEFCQNTYGIGDLNPRRKTENLINDALEAVAGIMEAGTAS